MNADTVSTLTAIIGQAGELIVVVGALVTAIIRMGHTTAAVARQTEILISHDAVLTNTAHSVASIQVSVNGQASSTAQHLTEIQVRLADALKEIARLEGLTTAFAKAAGAALPTLPIAATPRDPIAESGATNHP